MTPEPASAVRRAKQSLAAFRAAGKVQMLTSLRAPEHLVVIFLAPWYSLIFLAMTRETGRSDAASALVLGTGLVGIWYVAVNVASGAIQNDRIMGTLEMSIAAPTNYVIVLCGRIAPVVSLGLLAIPEAWLVGTLFFQVHIPLQHPGLIVLTLVVTLFATAGTSALLASVMVLSRNTRIIQGNLEYALYILGGTVFPLNQLPEFVQWIGRGFYLSWAASLLRDAALEPHIEHAAVRLTAIASLGLIALVGGILLIRYTIGRSRVTGRVSIA